MKSQVHFWMLIFTTLFFLITKLDLSDDQESKILTDASPSVGLVSCRAKEWIYSVAFSQDSKTVLASWDPGEVHLWDILTGNALQAFYHGPTSNTYSLAFSPDGNYVLAGALKEAILWSTGTGVQLRTFPRDREDPFGTKAIITPNGEYIVTDGIDGASIWEIESGRKIYSFTGQLEGHGTQLSPDGKYVLTGDTSPGLNTWWLWDAESGDQIHTFINVSKAGFSPNSDAVITNEFNKGLVLRNINTFKESVTFDVEEDHLFRWWQFSPDGTHILTEDVGSNILLWDAQEGVKVQSFDTDITSSYSFFPDSKNLLVIDYMSRQSSEVRTRFRVLSLEEDRVLYEITAPEMSISTYAISPNGAYVIIGTQTGELQLVNFQHAPHVQRLCLSKAVV